MAVGSFLLAIGLLTIPHDASFKQIFAQLQGGFANAKQSFIGSIMIAAGLVLAAIGAVIGLAQKKPA
jgi:hypothetical protein